MTSPPISLRPPTTLSLPEPPTFTPPPLSFLEGTWHVTHSTLPMWKSKRNVTITYKLLTPPTTTTTFSATDPKPQLDDLVSYQTLTSSKIKTVEGIDTFASTTGEWDWRGKGWLKIASSHCEVLGWGEGEGGQWVVTFFAKTLFTPQGIDIYSRRKEGVGETVVEGIREAFRGSEDPGLRELAGELFEVTRN